MTTHRGGCLCGRARFEVVGDFDQLALCHCSRCRKATGSAHGANLFSTRATLRWTGGQESVRDFRLPGTRHARSFCAACGSALPSIQMRGALVVVPAGSLDTPVQVGSAMHIFCAARAGWEDAAASAPRFDGLPPQPS